MAHQAVGIVLREFGDVGAGVRELREALRLARRSGLAEREADVLATLGVALVFFGRTAAGLTALDRAFQRSSGVLAAQVQVRRAIVLYVLGRYPAALDDLRESANVLRRAGDLLWTARALSARAMVYLARGQRDGPTPISPPPAAPFAGAGQELEAMYTVQNRAVAAFSRGTFRRRWPTWTGRRGYRTLNVSRYRRLRSTGARYCWPPGWPPRRWPSGSAVRGIENPAAVHKEAELMLTAANCALAAARPQTAQDCAQAAYRLFRSQQSTWWLAHAARVSSRPASRRARYSRGCCGGEPGCGPAGRARCR